MKKYQLYINGEFVDAKTNETEDVLNPKNEQVIAQVQIGGEEDVDSAVKAAKDAFPSWNATDPKERAKYVNQILQGMEERKQEIADAIVDELGASRTFSEDGQVPLSINEMKGTLEEFDKYEFEYEHKGSTVTKEGIGVIACITPWNYPLNQIQRKITPALLAGNTVVVKPASLTPISAMILAEIVDQTDLPKGVFNVVTGSGSGAGDYLAGHEDVDGISFTGSTSVGGTMYEKAASSIKHLVLELGGKSAMVYLEGGDLAQAVKAAADTVLDNQGQTCTALTRLLVPEDKLEETKEELKKYYADIKVGDPDKSDTKVGPLVSADQKEQVLEYIQKGKDEGAEVLIGGGEVEGEGYFVEPTVFTNVTNDMTIAREEIFGPVLTVLTYKDVDEAIKIANDSPYGLSGGVVGPEDQAIEVAKKLRTGQVLVNGADRVPTAPFGGYKQSGFGRENGLYGVDDYIELRSIHK